MVSPGPHFTRSQTLPTEHAATNPSPLYTLDDCEQLLAYHQRLGSSTVVIEVALLESLVAIARQIREWGG